MSTVIEVKPPSATTPDREAAWRTSEKSASAKQEVLAALKPLLCFWWIAGFWASGCSRYSFWIYAAHCLWRGQLLIFWSVSMINMGWFLVTHWIQPNSLFYWPRLSVAYTAQHVAWGALYLFLGIFAVRILRTERPPKDKLKDPASLTEIASIPESSYGFLCDVLALSAVNDVKKVTRLCMGFLLPPAIGLSSVAVYQAQYWVACYWGPIHDWLPVILIGVFIFVGSMLAASVVLSLLSMYAVIMYLLRKQVLSYSDTLKTELDDILRHLDTNYSSSCPVNPVSRLVRQRYEIAVMVDSACKRVSWFIVPSITIGSATSYFLILTSMGGYTLGLGAGSLTAVLVVICLLGGAYLSESCKNIEEALISVRSRLPCGASPSMIVFRNDLDSFIQLAKVDVMGFKVFGILITYDIVFRAIYIICSIAIVIVQSQFGTNLKIG
mmetsp:Transcript_26883/g.43896  ORF Transcript_26883/g.43896 Transcript_26883/m.43896 type:complete len:439 (-) Transcript_26883:632-1948(-)